MPIDVRLPDGSSITVQTDDPAAAAAAAKNYFSKQGGSAPTETKPSKGIFEYADDAARAFASGVTFGYADELAAKANSMLGSGSYEENLAKESARSKDISPYVKIPGEIAGGIAATVGAAPVTGAAAAATGFAKLPSFVRYLLGGTAIGALYGSGDAEPGQRLEGAKTGAAIGAATGVAAPYVVRGVSRTAQAVKNAIRPEAGASADLSRALARDNMTPLDVMTKANDLSTIRPDATLADVGGENVRGLVERIAQTPGAGRTQVIPALAARQEGQAMRVANDLRSLTGTYGAARQTIEATELLRRTEAQPLYDAAMDFNARAVPEIVKAFDEATRTGWGKLILNSKELKNNLQTKYGIDNVKDAPLMVLIDSWKKSADEIVGSANTGNWSKGNITDMKNKVVAAVDKYNPDYAKARAAWSDRASYLDAIESGKKALTQSGMDSEGITAYLAGLPANSANAEGFRIGFISALVNKMGNDASKLGDMTKYIRSPEMRAKIAAIMPTPEARVSWAMRLEHEIQSSEMTGRALANSATYRRQAEGRDANSIVGDLVFEALSGGSGASIWRRAMQAAGGAARDTLRSRTDAQLADVLVNPNAVNNLPSILRSGQTQFQPPRQGPIWGAIGGTNAALQ